MSIKQLLDLCPFKSSSAHTPLLPTPVPELLSKRFQKNQIKPKTRSDNQSKNNVISNSQKKDINSLISLSFDSPSNSPLKGKNDLDSTPVKEKSSNQINENTVLEYTPFPLKEKSSFNPKSISERELRKMDMKIKSKYLAYENPSAEILNNIQQSEVRAKKFMTNHILKKKKEEADNKKKWLQLHAGVEDPEEKQKGIKAAQKAYFRMKYKIAMLEEIKEMELRYLIEGQKDALDAIRLKEFLTPIQKPRIAKSFTRKDQQRLDLLLG